MDFDRLMERHKDAVYRQLLRMCGNREDAEDALTEALLGAYRASAGLREEEAFRGWLATIGRRVCIRMKRREDLAPILGLADLEVPAEPTQEDELEMGEMRKCVRDAVGALPDLYRETYILRELDERPAEEVAEKLGLTVAAVKSRLHRARRLVREHLDQSICVG